MSSLLFVPILYKLIRRTNGSLFPFNDWKLYHFVPNKTVDYQVRLLDESKPGNISGEEIENFIVREDPFTAHNLIRDLGRAHVAGDFEKRDRCRRLLEKNFIRRKTKYLLVQRTYFPLEFYRNGTRREEALATFEAGE